MSTYNEVDVECPQCGEEFRAVVWTAVHAGEDPELKDVLLGGELNMVCCTFCGHVFFREQFLLYQDPDEELVAYVYREDEKDRAAELRPMMLKGFAEAQAAFEEKDRFKYEPVLLFGLESLVEFLEGEQEQKDQADVAAAICREQDIPFRSISPGAARKKRLPLVLPLGNPSERPARDEVLAGLGRLLKENPALDFYQKTRQEIEKDKEWKL
jgi:hypothetical protein